MQLKGQIKEWISTWEGRDYADGIPDEADTVLESYGKVPSYRRIVKAILKNDNYLLSLGYSRPNSEVYGAIKRIEKETRHERIGSGPISNQTDFL